ncbi:MAG: mechanosensitive ion channel [Geobacter sp.]|nr:mechanosensitive ion channel [Geobacter sp.]
MQSLFGQIRSTLDIKLAHLGTTPVTLEALLKLLILLLLLFYLSGKLRSLIADRLLSHTKMEMGARQAVGSIVRYLAVVIGFVVILQTAGIDLTALNVLAGAVGIGLGFGLQNIVNNFISGLIILFERPIKVGGRIVVGEVEGDVTHIGGRSTTVVTNDNISIIVPNSNVITENVINWSHNDRKVRFKIPVTVAYGTDIEQLERLLLQVAAECPDVLQDPPPATRLMAFGDYGLQYELRVWSTTLIHRKGVLISKLNRAIYQAFREQGIEIPYPRRDVAILHKPLPSEPSVPDRP